MILNNTDIKIIGAWNKPFFDLKLISTNIFSMLPEGSILGNSLEGISSLTKSIKPPPCVVLSSFYGGVNPSKINWFRGNVLFNFVSDISKVSILLLTTSFSISNLFFIELIFKWAIIIRFGFFLCISFNASFFSDSSELVHSVDLWQVCLTCQCFLNWQRT